jgi:hypothetical protein
VVVAARTPRLNDVDDRPACGAFVLKEHAGTQESTVPATLLDMPGGGLSIVVWFAYSDGQLGAGVAEMNMPAALVWTALPLAQAGEQLSRLAVGQVGPDLAEVFTRIALEPHASDSVESVPGSSSSTTCIWAA